MSSGERSGQRNTKYFFDTYALIKIYEAASEYEPYIGATFFLTLLNLFEFHQYLLRMKDKAFADAELQNYTPHVIEFGMDTLKKASAFRHHKKRQNLSMSDCIGYTCALENNLLFLTGDKEFKGLHGVEFVR